MTLEPRLAAHMQVSSFLRRAQQQGDFATVLRRGDRISGAILLVGRVRGRNPMIFERFPTLNGSSNWEKAVNEEAAGEETINLYLHKRGERDPDLWIIELDTADDERLNELIGPGG